MLFEISSCYTPTLQLRGPLPDDRCRHYTLFSLAEAQKEYLPTKIIEVSTVTMSRVAGH